MKITELTGLPFTGAPTLGERDIAGLTADSRQVQSGFLFAALRGTVSDGRIFDAEASLYEQRFLVVPPHMTGGIIPQQVF